MNKKEISKKTSELFNTALDKLNAHAFMYFIAWQLFASRNDV